ncbi:MAG: hypothetical protein MR707_07950 [Galactobacillus timonensis]|uniref:hypothetical protein n=1 Tax=Galactobacillus timonensis TaxID=2041840 RepID=UPI0023F3D531|nr:hypothetical protein [Galactobacillus timonensis]MCI6068138.1 hypothetical protein [Galactobacillus timonensis]
MVNESSADISGYTLTVTGSTTAEVKRNATAEIILTNNYVPNTPGKEVFPRTNSESGRKFFVPCTCADQ